MSHAEITLLVLGVVAILFITETIPLAITAIGGAIALAILGVIPMNAVFNGLANSTVILLAGMFVVGSAMFHTGLAQKLAETLIKFTGKTENGIMLGTMILAVGISGFTSNVGTVVTLMPIVVGMCKAANVPVSRQLMPLAFAAGLGGICTMAGTPPNMVAVGVLKNAGFQPFGFFEFAWIGIPLSIVGVAYMMFIGKNFLPTVEQAGDMHVEESAKKEATASTNDPKKMWITALVAIVVVIVMALDLKSFPLHVAAVVGAIVLVLTKCMTEKQAYQSIDWVTIFLVAGMLPIADALAKSGAGKLVADQVVGFLGGAPGPVFVTAVLFILTAVLTQFMSNTAATLLLAPIGLSIAKGIGASPHAVVMAISVAASCAFASPVGTPTNTTVLKPGNYKFLDFTKAGSGLVLVCFIVSLIVIPLVWPFFPK